MKRTRRWEFVKQDAIRFAGLGLSDIEIASRLDLDRATVYRWRKAGRLEVALASQPRASVVDIGSKTAAEWAASVRGSYALDATDEELVKMAEAARAEALDAQAPWSHRFAAMREFRATVKQLNLVARQAPKDQPDEPEKPQRKTFEVPRRSGGDPRALLQAVK